MVRLRSLELPSELVQLLGQVGRSLYNKTRSVALASGVEPSYFITKLFISLLHDLSSGFKFGLGVLAAFTTVGLLAVAVTGVMNSFSDGEILSAGKLNTNFNSLKAAIESIPNWSKSGSDAVFSGGNVVVNGRISSSVLGTFCGATAASVTGNMGGFTGAKALCETACGNSNAHMCTAHETLISLQLGISFPVGVFWITSPTTSANTDALDCNSWTSSSAPPNQGSAIENTSPPAQLFISFCNNPRKIACCL
ncbi:MAG: hypothetical protein KBA66_12955 [Leptospiraceae bacterium]|nr:hypothetical protein [Leptospiraceae bacterium]